MSGEKKTAKNKYAKLLNTIGSILAVSSVIFVAIRINNYMTDSVLVFFNFRNTFLFIGLALIYGVSSLSLGCVWGNLLAKCGAVTSYRWSISIFGISQIAKYIPGNIFHFAGRQALGMADGISGKSLAKSTLIELMLLAISGGMFLIIVSPVFLGFNLSSIKYSIACFLLVLSIGTLLSNRLFGVYVTKAFFIQISFLTFSGFLFLLVLCLVNSLEFLKVTPWLIVFIPSVFITAWLIGLITPGAPAGLGIRELILIYFLSGYISNENILLTVMISRVITVLGDVVFYLISLYIRRVSLNV
ncbi:MULTISPECIES: hypothetical protein [unclassified Pantoea]|uniref:hypothetical protein n=1 Tax=unclassified Pantoea TaxID=2630326 RepID=UPI00301DCB15